MLPWDRRFGDDGARDDGVGAGGIDESVGRSLHDFVDYYVDYFVIPGALERDHHDRPVERALRERGGAA
jgi:hypothetical protein